MPMADFPETTISSAARRPKGRFVVNSMNRLSEERAPRFRENFFAEINNIHFYGYRL
jgi:hypothetical protein